MSEKDELKILFVEDLPTDVELACRELRKGGLAFTFLRVDSEAPFREALRSFEPDIVISDYSMPTFDGMAALIITRSSFPLLPFIILTGAINEDTAVACMKAGASDYVIKEHLTRLPFAVQEALRKRDILKASEEQKEMLRESESRYRSLFEESNAVMLVLDPETQAILEANKAAFDFYGWPPETLIGMRISDINTLSASEIAVEMERALTRQNHHFVFQHRLADGSVHDVETHSGPITLNGRVRLFSIIHDISDRVAAERDRDEFSARLSQYLSTSPTVTYSLRIQNGETTWLWVSENIKKLLGYTPEEALEPDWWFRNVDALDRTRILGGIAKIGKNGVYEEEYQFRKKDGALVWIRDVMRVANKRASTMEIVGTLTDVSARKKAEEELSLKSAALEATANAVAITNRDGAIKWINAAFERLSGYSRQEAMGRKLRDLVKSGKQDSALYREMWDTILDGRTWRGELVNRRKSGEVYPEEMTITPVRDESGRIESFVAIKNDITERRQARERLESSLREKDVLLREIHHRVKNNMQIITSLVNLSAVSDDPQVNHAISRTLGRRIQSMAIVHDQFYASPDAAHIDFSNYLRRLIEELRQDETRKKTQPIVSIEADEVSLTLEQAIPAGLILSELLENALRYAFPGWDAPGTIWVEQRVEGDSLRIVVRDDGEGFPIGFDYDHPSTLGLELIHILSEQLHGSVTFHNDRGAVAILRFPLAEFGGVGSGAVA